VAAPDESTSDEQDVVAIGDEDEGMSAPARLTLLARAPFRLHQHIRRVGCDAEGCPLGIGARRSEHRRIECGAASSSHRAIEPRSILNLSHSKRRFSGAAASRQYFSTMMRASSDGAAMHPGGNVSFGIGVAFQSAAQM
jgi:hypothetical protein